MSNEVESSKPQSNKLVVLIVALLVVLVVFAGLIIFLLTRPKETQIEPSPTGGRGTVVTVENATELQEQIANATPTPDGSYVTSMSIDWHFKGDTSTDAYVANVVENTRTVYFDLHLADTNEVIYSSPFIPVGAELKGITLDKQLEAGTYETILVYHLVDDDENEVSTLSIALTIYVE